MPDTWGSLHAGDVVLGSDGQEWGVEQVDDIGGLVVGLVRHGERVTGYPDADAPVTVVSRCDTAAEQAAWQALNDAGLQPQVISESWESSE